MTHLLKRLSNLIVTEFPFIIVFMILMGSLDHIVSLYSSALSESVLSYTLCCFSIWFILAIFFALIIKLANNRYITIFLYFFLFSLFAVQHYLLQNFGSPISPTYLVLAAETNANEINNFVSVYLSKDTVLPTVKVLLALIFFSWICEMIWAKYIRKKHFKAIVYNLISILAIPIIAFGIYNSRVYFSVLKESSPDQIRMIEYPDDFLSSLLSSIHTINIMNNNVKEAVNNTINTGDIHYSDNADSDLKIVLIIGESFNKYHSNLYGYYLDTNPFLLREKNEKRLYVFNDVVTPSNSTSVVLKNLLSCNNSSIGEPWFSQPFFPALFKKAGYDVYMWDNQRSFEKGAAFSFTLNGYIYDDEIANISYTQCNMESYSYDLDLVKSFSDSTVIDNYSGRQLSIFHLVGQHFNASSRFPHNKQFLFFNADSISRNDINLSKKQQIADYDNATRYNDYVINRIIELFEDTNCFLVYLSDHGEEVYDYRDQLGRDQGPITKDKVKFQYEIPFFVWTSSTYSEKHPTVIESLEKNQYTPFISDLISHMLLGVAGFECDYYNSEYDLLSPNYKNNCRVISDAKEIFIVTD